MGYPRDHVCCWYYGLGVFRQHDDCNDYNNNLLVRIIINYFLRLIGTFPCNLFSFPALPMYTHVNVNGNSFGQLSNV